MQITKPLIIIIVTASLLGVALGAFVESWVNPGQGQILSLVMTRTIDGVPWGNNTTLDWGLLERNSNNTFDDLTVVNNGTVPARISMTHTGQPANWIFYWTPNSTVIPVGANVSAPYILYVASDAVPGQQYYWSLVTTFEEA